MTTTNRPWVSQDVVTTQLPHLLSLSIVQMIIDILPSGAECILSLINSVDVRFIKFTALDEILAVFEHSLYFRFVLLYFIKKELKKKETCGHKKQNIYVYFVSKIFTVIAPFIESSI